MSAARTPSRAWSGLLGIFVALASSPGLALGQEGSVPETRLGTRIAPILLLSREDVRSELAMNPTQVESAWSTIASLHQRALALRGKSGPMVLAEREAIDRSQREWITRELAPAQQARLAQIDLQWEGPAALLSRPIVADTLEITADQRKKLTEALGRRDALLKQGRSGIEAQQALAESTLAVLTDVQRERWRGLLGPPFRPHGLASLHGGTADRSVVPASGENSPPR
jgi:hypothetical protein